MEESIKQKTFGGHGWIDSRVTEKGEDIIGGDLNGHTGKNSGGIQTSKSSWRLWIWSKEWTKRC